MLLKTLIFTIAFGTQAVPTPSGKEPESASDRETRMHAIADAVDLVSKTPGDAAAIITVWNRESNFSLWVHDGTIKADGGLAICMGSIHPSDHVPDWADLAGTSVENTALCAARTLQIVKSGYWMCGDNSQTEKERMTYAFEYYARGHCAKPREESIVRSNMWVRLQARFYRAFSNGKKNTE